MLFLIYDDEMEWLGLELVRGRSGVTGWPSKHIIYICIIVFSTLISRDEGVQSQARYWTLARRGQK